MGLGLQCASSWENSPKFTSSLTLLAPRSAPGYSSASGLREMGLGLSPGGLPCAQSMVGRRLTQRQLRHGRAPPQPLSVCTPKFCPMGLLTDLVLFSHRHIFPGAKECRGYNLSPPTAKNPETLSRRNPGVFRIWLGWSSLQFIIGAPGFREGEQLPPGHTAQE